jgi:protein TonB
MKARSLLVFIVIGLFGCASDPSSYKAQLNSPLDALDAEQVTPPLVIRQFNASFPRASSGNLVLSAGTRVMVIVSLTVGVDGLPHDISGKVTDTDSNLSGEKLQFAKQAFIDSAIDAVSKWRWRPATKNGRPVAVPCKIPFYITLNTN